jgi:hypothetical protein
MKKGSIIQFVGFITQLGKEEFMPQWEAYSKHLKTSSGTTTNLLEQEKGNKNKYRYLSLHEYREQDLRFNFMKERSSDHFTEQKVRVEQAGGYTPLQIGCQQEERGLKILAFLGQGSPEIEFFRQLSSYDCLNIFEAYYESCNYQYILEFFTAEKDSIALLQQLKVIPGVETAVYKESLKLQASSY